MGAAIFIAFFAGLSASLWAVAWLAAAGKDGWGWILFAVVLLFGSMSIKSSDIATCPKCGEVFKVKSAEDGK